MTSTGRRALRETLTVQLDLLREEGFPGLRRRSIFLTDKTVRQRIERLEGLRGIHSGQRCFIMGNGPSLNKMDLSVFSGEHVWGSNKCYLLFDRIDWRPDFYVAIDTRVVPDIAGELHRIIPSQPESRFFFPLHFREGRILRSFKNTYWYRELPFLDDDPVWGHFSADVVGGVYIARTVTVAALQLAVHLGFDPIYLIGCDTDYRVPSTARREGSSIGLTSTQNDDPNHFDPTYFGTGSRWHEPFPEKMIAHYERSKEACDALGIRVFNATVGGKLEVFPRVDYRDLF